jgi:hypothetical protein
MSAEFDTIQRSYIVSKSRADELLNLYCATPFHHKRKIELALQSYRAISTILYGSLSACQIDQLEVFVKDASKDLPVSLFDLREWINVIEIASNHRFLQSKQIAVDIFGKPVDDLKTDLKVLSEDVVTQLNSINSTVEMFKNQLLPLLKDDAKKFEDLQIAYQELIKDKNIIIEEKKIVLRDTKSLNKKLIDEETSVREKLQLQTDMANILEKQQEKIIKKLKSEIEDKIVLLASNKASFGTKFKSMKEEYEIKLEKKNYQLKECNTKLDDSIQNIQKLNEKYDENNDLNIKLLKEQYENNMKQSINDSKLIFRLKDEEISKLKEALLKANLQNSDNQKLHISEKSDLILIKESLESKFNEFKLANENKDLDILKLNEENISLKSTIDKLNKIEKEKFEV